MAPVAISTSTTQTIESIKQAVGGLTLNATPTSSTTSTLNLREYASFDNSPSIGTEFREFSKDGKPVLSIKEVLQDESKLKALGRLV
jgi:hypothetical protein